MKRIVSLFVLILLTQLAGTRATAQNTGAARLETSMLNGLKWRSIGPANTGGRIDDFAVARVPGAPDAIYVATASGGIFKSTTAGTSWFPIFDEVNAMQSIGDITVAPSNPNIVWTGTGEANNRQSSSWGDGVYKSVDAGLHWKNVGLKETRHIGRIVIHPANPDVVYVAAVGHLWGSNPDRGVFKTTDGGETWKKVLFVDDNTGATDLIMDPQDPQTLFAATYQRQRKAWGFNGGGPGSGIYRTYDGGAAWTRLAAGLPRGDKGRIGLDVFQKDGRIVYATVEARDGGLFRSVDRGENWERLTSMNPRPMYYSQVRIDPNDKNRVYILGSNRGFYISDDGGRNFREVFSTVHSEDHALWIDPDDTNHLILGGDGGVSISWNRGENWMFRDNLPIGQFYEINVDMRDPYYVCGGLQDNGLWCIPSATRNRNGIANSDAYNIGGGDGMYAAIDPKDPNTIYIESQNGNINRVNLTTMERQAIVPIPPERGPNEARYRWNWDTPVVISNFDSATIYMGANFLFKSTNRGATWAPISPDLTSNINRDNLEMMGGKIPPDALSRHDGQSTYSALTTIGESPVDARVLYTGADDGTVQVTRDGGKTWTNITSRIPNLPANTYVTAVAPSRHAAGRVYATFDGHYNDDYRPYVYASDDYGQTWRSLSQGLPETGINRIREHPKNPRLIFAGHEKGAHVSIDGGGNWAALNIPDVPVDDIAIHPRDNSLVLGTHGRGIWILDDIAPLESMTAEVLASPQHLMPIPAARLVNIYSPQSWFGAGEFFAPNPGVGASITYYLRDAASRSVTIKVSDGEGRLLRTMTGPPVRGLNRVFWDLRYDSPAGGGDDVPPGVGGFGGTARGPAVIPGKYKVAIEVPGGGTVFRDVDVLGDPLVKISDGDRRSRQAALMDVYELQKTLVPARTAIRTLRESTEAIQRQVAPAAKTSFDKLVDQVGQVQRALDGQFNSVSGVGRAIDGFTGIPTPTQLRQIDWAYEDARKSIGELNQLSERDVPAMFGELTAQKTFPAAGPKVALPPPRRR